MLLYRGGVVFVSSALDGFRCPKELEDDFQLSVYADGSSSAGFVEPWVSGEFT